MLTRDKVGRLWFGVRQVCPACMNAFVWSDLERALTRVLIYRTNGIAPIMIDKRGLCLRCRCAGLGERSIEQGSSLLV